MHESLARHAFTDAEAVHQFHGILLQDPCAHPAFHVFTIALLDDDAVDSTCSQEQRQEHPRRSRTDDADLRAHPKPRTRSDSRAKILKTQDTLMRRSLVIRSSYQQKQLMGIGERNA